MFKLYPTFFVQASKNCRMVEVTELDGVAIDDFQHCIEIKVHTIVIFQPNLACSGIFVQLDNQGHGTSGWDVQVPWKSQ